MSIICIYYACMYACMHACMHVCIYVSKSTPEPRCLLYIYIATELRLTYGPCSQQGHDGYPPTSQSCLPKTSVVQRKIWNTVDVATLECVGVCSLPFLNPLLILTESKFLVLTVYILSYEYILHCLLLSLYGSLLLGYVHKFLQECLTNHQPPLFKSPHKLQALLHSRRFADSEEPQRTCCDRGHVHSTCFAIIETLLVQ